MPLSSRLSEPGRQLPQGVREFVVDPAPEPAYLELARSGELRRRAEAAVRELRECRVCPRDCGVDRLDAVPSAGSEAASRRDGRVAGHIPPGTACFTGRWARVASAFPHFGEEDCLRGWRGSGTIFFSFCNLRCVFCQNWDISQDGEGVEVGPERLAALMLELQAAGCHNINLVTPEHVVPQVLEALALAVPAGLRIPLVYNTSAYDSLRSLQLLDGVVDVYMPDFKVWDPQRARRHLKAADYPEVARRVIREMHRQVGPLRFDRHGIAVRGLLVRHLVLPGAGEDTREILRFLAAEVSPDTYVNLMDQYRPAGAVAAGRYPEIARRPTPAELEAAFRAAREVGLWRFDRRWL